MWPSGLGIESALIRSLLMTLCKRRHDTAQSQAPHLLSGDRSKGAIAGVVAMRQIPGVGRADSHVIPADAKK